LAPETRTLETVAWPADLEASFARMHEGVPQVVVGNAPRSSPPMLFADAIDSRTPALMIAVPHMTRTVDGDRFRFVTDPSAGVRLVIVALDAGELQRRLLEPLVAKYFGERGRSDYLVTISRHSPSLAPSSSSSGEAGSDAVVYNSAPAPLDASSADVSTGLFNLRMDDVRRFADTTDVPPILGTRLSIAVFRKAVGTDGTRLLMANGDDQGAWLARLRYRTGSLDAIVAQSRRRNLAISLGVLGLLAASFVLIVASAQRQQRLSRQQMEFVAAVSHELRTPLAVICSAGENLADGVVADAPQVKRYGALIETEGRRLGDMVERVMAFAGISSGAPSRSPVRVEVAEVIAEAVDGVKHEARDRGVTIAVNLGADAHRDRFAVAGDPDALRSAFQNIVGNAVKYSPQGATVDVEAFAEGPAVNIRVVDRGLGIDTDDLPHVFKPFYRGRRAVGAEVRGSGVGLSVVRHVIDAHRGTVAIDSRAGEGTTVTVMLPAAVDAVADGTPSSPDVAPRSRAAD
jgi:signal transduction histidine kinase